MKLALRALYTYHQKNVKSSNKNVKETWETTYPNKCAPVFYTVFENPRKSLIQLCERSELRLHFEWTKVHKKCQNSSQFWRVFENARHFEGFSNTVFLTVNLKLPFWRIYFPSLHSIILKKLNPLRFLHMICQVLKKWIPISKS